MAFSIGVEVGCGAGASVGNGGGVDIDILVGTSVRVAGGNAVSAGIATMVVSICDPAVLPMFDVDGWRDCVPCGVDLGDSGFASVGVGISSEQATRMVKARYAALTAIKILPIILFCSWFTSFQDLLLVGSKLLELFCRA